MGLCCSTEEDTTALSTANVNIQMDAIGRMNDDDSAGHAGNKDEKWLNTYPGQVYKAIKQLHKDPKSFTNFIDRVYADLVPQISQSTSEA